MPRNVPRTVLQVDLKRLRENFAAIKRSIAPCRALAVVKTDAYGLGMMPVAEALRDEADAFAVAEVADGIALTPLGKPVIALGALFPDEIESAVETGLVLPVGSEKAARRVSEAACKAGKTAEISVVVDGGMGRVGFPLAEALPRIFSIARLPHLALRGIYTHCPAASLRNDAGTLRETADFRHLVENLAGKGVAFRDVHIAASDAINSYLETIEPPFNLARIGLLMYGAQKFSRFDLPGVCRFVSRLLEIRRLPAQSTLGYGRTYSLKKDSVVGTVGCGYACGMPLALSNRGRVLVRGVSCPVVGRVSMDYATVLLDGVPDAAVGDEAVLFGEQGNARIDPSEWAEIKGTHVHDIFCSISGRIPRSYHK